MAGIGRVHGRAATGVWYGYTPVVVKIAATGKFTADSVNGTTGVITDGGYAKAVKAVQQFGSIIWLGAQTADTFCAIVDQPSFNQGDGMGGKDGAQSGAGALKDALALNCGGVAGDYTVTTSMVLNGDGTFTFA